MPPDQEDLPARERQTILDWYWRNIVLRDGKPHIGPSPLRRLTRYEIENSLEELLSVELKRPYVFSPESSGLLPSTIEEIYPADLPGESGFDNDALRMRQAKLPLLKYIDCVDYALRVFDQRPQARGRILGFRHKPASLEEPLAKKTLWRFADRAARGYQNHEDRDRIFHRYKSMVGKHDAYTSLLAAMKTVLLSPSFLYRLETSREQRTPYPVAPHELAVRLSYFLWSSMPDRQLFEAAAEGSLLEKEILLREMRRMLNSPKRIALAENFAGQWLGFDELKRNKTFYRGERWTRGVYDELLFGFDELIKSNRNVLELVSSDWKYLRREAARREKLPSLRFDAKYADIFSRRRSRQGLKVEQFYAPPRLYRTGGERGGGEVGGEVRCGEVR